MVKPFFIYQGGRDFRRRISANPMQTLLPSVILCDFDGTITEVDTSEVILDKFSNREDWLREDRLFEAGKISLEDCMKRQFRPVRATESEMVAAVEGVKFRDGFKDLVDFCHLNRIEIIVVSAGLDFIIQRKLADLGTKVRFVSPTASITPLGVRLKFPQIPGDGPDFKVRLLNSVKREGKRVYYIGDGASDYAAASEADFIFAVKGSPLAGFCQAKQLVFKEFQDFTEILSTLPELTP